jgi:hypothetical protein
MTAFSMHFTFSTTIIASISRAALLKTLASHKVDARLSYKSVEKSFQYNRATLRTEGDECIRFTNHKDLVDVGVLSCGQGNLCLNDDTSSTGSRCFSPVKNLRRSNHTYISCAYLNGTAGKKCEGDWACAYVDQEQISCGSCIGYASCLNNNATVAESSCRGDFSCWVLNGEKAESLFSSACIMNSPSSPFFSYEPTQLLQTRLALIAGKTNVKKVCLDLSLLSTHRLYFLLVMDTILVSVLRMLVTTAGECCCHHSPCTSKLLRLTFFRSTLVMDCSHATTHQILVLETACAMVKQFVMMYRMASTSIITIAQR